MSGILFSSRQLRLPVRGCYQPVGGPRALGDGHNKRALRLVVLLAMGRGGLAKVRSWPIWLMQKNATR